MMSRHFRLSSELTGAIAKRLPHAKNQLSAPCSFFNQFVTEIYIYKYESSFISKDDNACNLHNTCIIRLVASQVSYWLGKGFLPL